MENKKFKPNILAGLSAVVVAILGIAEKETILNKEYFKFIGYCVVILFVALMLFMFGSVIYTTMYEMSIKEGNKKWFAVIGGLWGLLLLFIFELWITSKM